MQEGPVDAATPPGEPAPGAPVLAEWIRDLLASVHATRVRNLHELSTRIEDEVLSWDDMRMAQALQALYSGGRQLHFALLRPAWWQRLLARHRAAFRRFAAAADHMDEAAAAVKQEAESLDALFGEHNRRAARLFLEFESESRELALQVEQGVGWLQPMCEDINRQRAKGGSDRRLGALAEAAQSYTQTFKRLEHVSSMAHDIRVRGAAILGRRGALLAQVGADMDSFHMRWTRHVGDLADAVRRMVTPLPGIGKAIEAHDDAMKRLEAALDACGALQGEEHFLARQLEALRETLAERP